MAYIDDIDEATPDDLDNVSGGALEIRDLKADIKGSFTSLGLAAVTRTAAELNAAISADSTDTLTNKTIDTATYQGNQTGFVGDVDGDITGNASTVTTNANQTGDVTSIGNDTTISDDSVTNLKIGENEVTFARSVSDVVLDTTVLSDATGVVLPSAGVWNLGLSTTTIASADVFVEINCGTSGWQVMREINHTGGGNVLIGEQVVADSANVRVRCANSLTFNARRIFR